MLPRGARADHRRPRGEKAVAARGVPGRAWRDARATANALLDSHPPIVLLTTLFPSSVRRRVANAEVLRWQARFRIVFGLFVGLAGGGLHATGVLELSPAAERLLGHAGALAAHAALTAAYLAAVLLVDRHVRRAAMRLVASDGTAATTATGALARTSSFAVGAGVGRGAVALVTAADLALIFGTVFFLTPASHYARALLLSLFGLQVTQIYFGRAAAAVWAVTTEIAYALLVQFAEGAGVAVSWPEELWTLTIYAFGATIFILLQGNQAVRLGRLVRMFERVEEGDFSLTYDVHGDSRPDNVTLVGRAYNRMRAQLATIVLTDPLSGCLNRRGFEQQIARDVRRAARSNGELALIAVDLDHFKQVNDTFGHLAGDSVIEEAGALLRQTARGGDVVGRIGGEEFVILAPETGLDGATHVAERVVEAFRTHRFRGVDGKRPVTVSVGVVADRVRDEHSASDLRARADEALYVAKRAGRDRMVVWGDAARLTSEWAMKGLMTTGAFAIDGGGAYPADLPPSDVAGR